MCGDVRHGCGPEVPEICRFNRTFQLLVLRHERILPDVRMRVVSRLLDAECSVMEYTDVISCNCTWTRSSKAEWNSRLECDLWYRLWKLSIKTTLIKFQIFFFLFFQDFTLDIAKTFFWGKFSGGITICLDTYCDIYSVRQHNCLYYTR